MTSRAPLHGRDVTVLSTGRRATSRSGVGPVRAGKRRAGPIRVRYEADSQQPVRYERIRHERIGHERVQHEQEPVAGPRDRPGPSVDLT